MQLLEQTILKYGKVYAGDVLKVDSFLNHQVDVALLNKMGAELAGRFAGEGITKVLTLEASGIAVAIMAALSLGVKMVFAKKAKTSNSSSDRGNGSFIATLDRTSTPMGGRMLKHWIALPVKDIDEINRLRKEAEYNALPIETKLEFAIKDRDKIKSEFEQVKKVFEEQQKKAGKQ